MFKPLEKGLSVVMMGRNEEGFLPESLPPLFQVADEVVFVDTGSTDRTLEIVRDWGCRVFSLPWRDDFSAPKNHALEQARFRWVLNADCDEMLQEPLRVKEWLWSLAEDDPAPAYRIDIDHLVTDAKPLRRESLRLFRNDVRIRFSNPVHEGIAESLYENWPDFILPKADILFKHYGYLAGNNRQKLFRNVLVLRKWVEREPDNLYALFKLGTSLCQQGANSEGSYYLGQAFTLLGDEKEKGSIPFGPKLLQEYCKALLQDGKREQAEEAQRVVRSWFG